MRTLTALLMRAISPTAVPVVCVARMLDYYKTHNALGNISSAFRIIQAYVPAPAGTFTKTALVDALSAAYAQWESGGTMPETITVNTSSLDKVQYFHAAIKVLLNAKTTTIQTSRC